MAENIQQIIEDDPLVKYNQQSIEEVYRELGSRAEGLTYREVIIKRKKFGKNEVFQKKKKGLILELLSRFNNPLVIALIIIAVFSWFFGEKISTIIVILMATLSVVLSYVQEHRAEVNAEKLKAMVKITTRVIRSGQIQTIPLTEVVPGDVVDLEAGAMVPGDLKLIASKDIFVNQSALNGESFPAEKHAYIIHRAAKSIYDLDTILCMGSSIVSGTGQGLIINIGKQTEFGKLSEKLILSKPETAFDKGIKDFTWMMIKFVLILAGISFIANSFFKHNIIDSLLFSLAIAVGLAPEMLPMIVTVNLSRGALRMSKKKVIIKRLDAIQNFGAMDILCTDKTGTLTQNDISLIRHCDVEGKESEAILKDAFINSSYQSGLNNLLDQAIIKHKTFDLSGYQKIDEIPFDFERKLVSVVVESAGQQQLIVKGAPEEVIKRCSTYWQDDQINKLDQKELSALEKLFTQFSNEGYRVLAVAAKIIDVKKKVYEKNDEANLVFKGYLAFLDPPKATVAGSIKELNRLGIGLKILSGDNELVNRRICEEVGLVSHKILLGEQIEKMSAEELAKAVEETNVFARVMPLQKERIILALKQNNHIVGFLGDGINDSPALKAADVGISVNNAVDIAKETADIILLENDFMVLGECVKVGRLTYANTLKYIKTGTSCNFGNSISLTSASFFLPIYPMLPMQLLLNNFLYDISQIAIPSDNVDADYLLVRRPWDIGFIKNFILWVGPVVTIFDFITFAVMWKVFHANPSLFYSGWFIESLFVQTIVVHVIRTNKLPLWQSRPSAALFLSTAGIAVLGCLIPYTPLADLFGFAAPPLVYFIFLIGIALAYFLLAQVVKNWFIKKYGYE